MQWRFQWTGRVLLEGGEYANALNLLEALSLEEATPLLQQAKEGLQHLNLKMLSKHFETSILILDINLPFAINPPCFVRFL